MLTMSMRLASVKLSSASVMTRSSRPLLVSGAAATCAVSRVVEKAVWRVNEPLGATVYSATR